MSATEIDDPEKPEFASYDSYRQFAFRVRHQRRYVWGEHTKAFIETVLATLKDRDVPLRKGMILFRAQSGIEYYSPSKNRPEEPSGYNATRMKPRPNRSTEGRANAAGVSVLYLGTTDVVCHLIVRMRPFRPALALNLRFFDAMFSV